MQLLTHCKLVQQEGHVHDKYTGKDVMLQDRLRGNADGVIFLLPGETQEKKKNVVEVADAHDAQVLAEPGTFDGELVVLCRKAANLQITILPIPKAVTDKFRKATHNSQFSQPTTATGGNRTATRNLSRSPGVGGVMAKIRSALEEKRASESNRGSLSSPPLSTTSPATPVSRKQHVNATTQGSRSNSFVVPTTPNSGTGNHYASQ